LVQKTTKRRGGGHHGHKATEELQWSPKGDDIQTGGGGDLCYQVRVRETKAGKSESEGRFRERKKGNNEKPKLKKTLWAKKSTT